MYSLVFLSCALTLALAGYSHHNVHDYNDDHQYDNYNEDHQYDNYNDDYHNYNDDNQYNNHQEYNEHNRYHGPIHIPVIGPHGVPVEPHAVQAARAQHLAAHSKESSHNGWIPHNTYGDHHQNNNHQEYNEHNKYHGPLHIPVINHHGVPVEPHAVQAARAQHLAAHNKGYGFHHGASVGHYYRRRRSLDYNGYAQHAPIIGHHGVPAETPEVQAARAQHLAALSQASTHNSYNSYNNYNDDNNSHDNYDNYNDEYQNNNHQEYNEQNKYHGPIHIPVIGPHGVPVEPKEVQAARAHHLSAYSDASAHSSWNSHDDYNDNNQYNGDHQHNNNQQYNEHNKYHGPIHIPVIGPHGVPVETPEVQAAKAEHLASHNKVGGLYQGAQYNSHYNPAPAGHYSYNTGAQGYNQHHY